MGNGRFHLEISISGIYNVLVSGMTFNFAHFAYKGSFGQIWVKLQNDLLDLKIYQKKACSSGKSRLFAENFVQRFK